MKTPRLLTLALAALSAVNLQASDPPVPTSSLPTATTIDAADWIKFVDTSDTSASPNGTDKKIAQNDFKFALGLQPLDADITSIAALSTTSYGRSFLELSGASAGRTLLGLGTAATSPATAFEPAAGNPVSDGYVWSSTAAGVRSWVAAGGTGTVTSVALTLPSGLSVAGSPVTSSGTLAVSTTLSGIIKGTGSGFTAATSGTDYLTPTGSGAGLSGVALTGGSYSNPSWITSLPASKVTGIPVEIGVAYSDETTAITTGTAKVTFRAPFAFTLTGVRASLTTASSSGVHTIDINEGGASVLGVKLSIDANERTSTTAATAATISDSAIADDAEITIDVDAAGTGATGGKVWFLGTR